MKRRKPRMFRKRLPHLTNNILKDTLNKSGFRRKKAWICGLFSAKTTLNQCFLRDCLRGHTELLRELLLCKPPLLAESSYGLSDRRCAEYIWQHFVYLTYFFPILMTPRHALSGINILPYSAAFVKRPVGKLSLDGMLSFSDTPFFSCLNRLGKH